MLKINLFKTINAAKQVLTKKTPSPTIARTVLSKGNGQKRVIVQGFGGQNLDSEQHFKLVDYMYKLNYRPVIKGFNEKLNEYKGMVAKPLTARPGRGFVKFFPNFRNPKMTRHIVHDIPTQRIEIQGFTNEVSQGKKLVGEIPVKPVQLPKQDDLVAKERVVIQGFSGKGSQPVYKEMNPEINTEPRKIIKGFRA